jgi:hypothetical protein
MTDTYLVKTADAAALAALTSDAEMSCDDVVRSIRRGQWSSIVVHHRKDDIQMRRHLFLLSMPESLSASTGTSATNWKT